jgi:hypothetical protein
VRDLADFVERRLNAAPDTVQPPAESHVRCTLCGQREAHASCDQPLLRAIVEVPCESPPLVVDGVAGPRARALQFAQRLVPGTIEFRVLGRQQRGCAGRLQQLRFVLKLGVVDQRHCRSAVALDHSHGGPRSRLDRVVPGSGLRIPEAQLQSRVAEWLP